MSEAQAVGVKRGSAELSFAPLAPTCGASLALAGLTTFEIYLAPTGTVTSSPLTAWATYDPPLGRQLRLTLSAWSG